MNSHLPYSNCIILLMGFAGVGKLTTAKELVKYPNFKLVDNHLWNNVIFRLIEQDGITPLPEKVWEKSGQVCDIVFETIRELSPEHFSFVFTQEMIEGDEYSKRFYEKILNLVKDKKSKFLPVRLECNEAELVRRVQIPARRDAYKTIDFNRAAKLVHEHQVFHTEHSNEITIDTTTVMPSNVVDIILRKLNALL